MNNSKMVTKRTAVG